MPEEAEFPDHPLLRAWFASNANAIRIIETPIRLVYEQALRDEAAGVNRHATRGLGDAAFGWLLPNLQTVVTRGTVPLVLIEDRNLSLTLADHQVAHILSTRAWLVGLQSVIASAAAVIRQIERHGRMLSTLQTDAPAHVDGYASDWIDKAS